MTPYLLTLLYMFSLFAFYELHTTFVGAKTTGAELYYNEGSSPFISRWGFQELCDHVFDPWSRKDFFPTKVQLGGVSFDPQAVKPGDLIFVRNIQKFMKKMHDEIPVPYIMVIHGEFVETFTDEHLNYLDDEKIVACFSVHPPYRSHPKYFPIPLGIAQSHVRNKGQEILATLFSTLRTTTEKEMLLWSILGVNTVARTDERVLIANMFKDKPFYETSSKRLSFEDYMKKMASSVYTLSPRGFGPDCYRTWEALIVGTITIVKRGEHDILDTAKDTAKKYQLFRSNRCTAPICSQLDSLYKDLPILVIDEWSEITEEFLEEKYKEITSKKYDISPLFMDYWCAKIRAVQQEFLEKSRLSTEQSTKAGIDPSFSQVKDLSVRAVS